MEGSERASKSLLRLTRPSGASVDQAGSRHVLFSHSPVQRGSA